VGAYLGLTPGKDQSGDSDKQLRISKAGHVTCACCWSCALSTCWAAGQTLRAARVGAGARVRGGKAAKKRAVVAVARKLAVQLHALWLSQEPYDPFHAAKKKTAAPGSRGTGDRRTSTRGGPAAKQCPRSSKPARRLDSLRRASPNRKRAKWGDKQQEAIEGERLRQRGGPEAAAPSARFKPSRPATAHPWHDRP